MNAWEAPPQHAIVLASGGPADAVLAHWLTREQARVTLFSVDDGRRHRGELDGPLRLVQDLECEHTAAWLPGLADVLGPPAPAESAAGATRVGTLPSHCMLLLDLAVGHAATRGADAVAYAGYDGRPGGAEFISAYQEAALAAYAWRLVPGFRVLAPFVDLALADVVELGAHLGVPFGRVWSCRDGAVHCGTCEACVERREAFTLARVQDPTVYALAEAVR